MRIDRIEINTFFDNLNTIYEDRHRYSLEWAFRDAQTRLDAFKADVIDKKLKRKCERCRDQNNVEAAYQGLQQRSGRILKKTKWYRRLFANMYLAINLVEILLSMALVVGLSHLSHSGASFIHSETLSFWFVVIFAFLKVAIERYHIKPRIDEWGWTLYARSTSSLKLLTLELYDQADGKTGREKGGQLTDLETVFKEFAAGWEAREA